MIGPTPGGRARSMCWLWARADNCAPLGTTRNRPSGRRHLSGQTNNRFAHSLGRAPSQRDARTVSWAPGRRPASGLARGARGRCVALHLRAPAPQLRARFGVSKLARRRLGARAAHLLSRRPAAGSGRRRPTVLKMNSQARPNNGGRRCWAQFVELAPAGGSATGGRRRHVGGRTPVARGRHFRRGRASRQARRGREFIFNTVGAASLARWPWRALINLAAALVGCGARPWAPSGRAARSIWACSEAAAARRHTAVGAPPEAAPRPPPVACGRPSAASLLPVASGGLADRQRADCLYQAPAGRSARISR